MLMAYVFQMRICDRIYILIKLCSRRAGLSAGCEVCVAFQSNVAPDKSTNSSPRGYQWSWANNALNARGLVVLHVKTERAVPYTAALAPPARGGRITPG